MSMVRKLLASGVATRVVAEARKPENQARAKAAVQKVRDRRRPRPR